MTWVVTGGSSGIGEKLVSDLTDAGEEVIVWDLNASSNPAASFEHVDLTAPNEIEAAADKITGPVTAFVHCAGVPMPTNISDENVASKLRLSYELHVVAFVRSVAALQSKLIEGSGSVVAIASAALEVVYPATLAYGASKAALERAVQQLAVELGPVGIRVNAVAPGAVSTPMTKAFWDDPKLSAERRSFIPLGLQTEPSGITSVVRFLASNAAAYVTGETIWADGGVRRGIFAKGVQEAAGTLR